VVAVGSVAAATDRAACWLKSPSRRRQTPPMDQIRVCPDRCDDAVCAVPVRST
jgi:hypothetical protein